MDSSLLRSYSDGEHMPTSRSEYYGATSDYDYQYKSDPSDIDEPMQHNEFGDFNVMSNRSEKVLRTGRQRKKLAARTKGGEFATRRKKRRVYFCSLASDIDIQKLHEHLQGNNLGGWYGQMYPSGEVLHLYKPSVDNAKTIASRMSQSSLQNAAASKAEDDTLTTNEEKNEEKTDTTSTAAAGNVDANKEGQDHFEDRIFKIYNAQEVFIFDFGAVVFWGFSRGEEATLLKTFRLFVTKGLVEKDEFESGEDDMAFSTSPNQDKVSLTNDFITLPDESPVKQRLSVSFAIAQSSVLAIFESRVEKKVEQYKYIPETLAKHGKVQISERQLGIMIGEVFVVRHDVNLHTEILDTPAFFWKEDMHEPDYSLMMSYMEMKGRTEILNKRLDMMRELLDVLQHQMENEHGIKLEWIVIYLIIVEVVLQAVSIIFQ